MNLRPLVGAIVEMHHHTRSPYDLFVAETLRRLGVPISDPEPDDAVRADLEAAQAEYFKLALAEDPFFDVLGPAYSEVCSAGRREIGGQFFTPWDLSVVTVRATLGDWTPRRNPDDDVGLWRMYEPACGAGALVCALLHEVAHRHGPEALRLWSVTAVDLDLGVARTCALQVLMGLGLHGWGVGEIVVRHGDSLAQRTISTVLHVSSPRPWSPPPTKRRQLGPQLGLFAGSEAA